MLGEEFFRLELQLGRNAEDESLATLRLLAAGKLFEGVAADVHLIDFFSVGATEALVEGGLDTGFAHLGVDCVGPLFKGFEPMCYFIGVVESFWEKDGVSFAPLGHVGLEFAYFSGDVQILPFTNRAHVADYVTGQGAVRVKSF